MIVFKSKYWQNNLGDPIFLKACFVLDTTEHIICKNGELGISCNIVMRERVFVVWRKKILGENLLFFWGGGGFPISGIAKLFQSNPNSIVFWDYARYLQKTSFKMHHLLRSKVGTSHKDGQLEKKKFVLFFHPRTYHQANNWELEIWSNLLKVISLWCLLFNKQRMYDLNKTFVKISMYLLAFWAIVLIFIGLINYWDVWPVMIALVIPIKLL
jgi:hypothetical protein